MKRRSFIRLAGGGVLTAAGSWLLAGDVAALPLSANAAWRLAGQENDPRRWALAHALLAPNPHNLQPWIADLRQPGEIILALDPARTLPATDPYSRQIMMGAGAFLELLAIAASQAGWRAEIQPFPEGDPGDAPHSRPFARVRLHKDEQGRRDPLYRAILHRRTERGAYDPVRPLGQDRVNELRATLAGLDVSFGVAGVAGGGAHDSARLEAIKKIAREAWAVEMRTEATFMESARLMRIGSAEIEKHRDGIALDSTLIVMADKLGLFSRKKFPGADSMAIRSQRERFDSLTASTPSYLWINTADNGRRAQIDAGRAYARVNLAGTAMGLAMHPNEQALQEFKEVAPQYDAIHRLLAPGGNGRTVQMLARVGYLPEGVVPSEPAPRRGLAAHLRG